MLTELTARGLLADATPGLGDRLAKGPITGYVGFDPTADSLHVGNLVPVMGLVWLQRTGGRPIALVGGGTALVGDPSGKRSERPVLPVEVVAANAAAIKGQLARFLDFDGPNAARLLNNVDWLGPLKLLDFLRDAGKHFTVNYMLQKESVKSRMDEGLSFTEFTYMLVQAYDFAHLHGQHGCELQLGGTDQWGNITAGIELVARQTGATVHGAVLPLLTTATGAKFGKSEGGNVWLDPAKTSPYKFYQFWLNSDDRDVERFLKTFTVFELDRIAELMAEQTRDPGRRAAQRALATDVTARVHGAAALDRVIAASDVVFGGREVRSLDRETLEIVAAEVPTKDLEHHVLAGGLGILDALHRAELTSSMADGRRGIQGASFSVNGTKVTKPDLTLTEADLIDGSFIALQKGKKNIVLLRVASRGAN